MKMLAGVEIQKMKDLANFLETVPPEDFDLSMWRSRNEKVAIMLGPIVLRRGCGFAGCAMGWAAESGLFPELRLNRNGVICYKGATEFEAAAKFLGVTVNQALYFFDGNTYEFHADPAHVADRIRRFAFIVERRMARRQSMPLRLAAVSNG